MQHIHTTRPIYSRPIFFNSSSTAITLLLSPYYFAVRSYVATEHYYLVASTCRCTSSTGIYYVPTGCIEDNLPPNARTHIRTHIQHIQQIKDTGPKIFTSENKRGEIFSQGWMVRKFLKFLVRTYLVSVLLVCQLG